MKSKIFIFQNTQEESAYQNPLIIEYFVQKSFLT